MKNPDHRWFDSKFVQHTLGGLDCFPAYMQVYTRRVQRLAEGKPLSPCSYRSPGFSARLLSSKADKLLRGNTLGCSTVVRARFKWSSVLRFVGVRALLFFS